MRHLSILPTIYDGIQRTKPLWNVALTDDDGFGVVSMNPGYDMFSNSSADAPPSHPGI